MRYYLKTLAFLCLALIGLCSQVSLAQTLTFDQITEQLITAKQTKQKTLLIEQLAAVDDERKQLLLESLQQGSFYYRKEDKRPVYITREESGYALTDVLSGEAYGVVKKTKVRKVSINNTLRKQLRTVLAWVSLSDEDVDIRLGAATELLKSPDSANIELIKSVLAEEKNPAVKVVLQQTLAVIYLASEVESERLVAIADLEEIQNKEVMQILANMLEKNEAGEFSEPSEKVRAAAESALNGMRSEEKFYSVVENLFFGLSLGSVLLLAAVGLAITFGVMGVINMAHGEMIMLGAYTTYVIQVLMPNYIEMSLLIAIPAAFLVSGMFGIIIERTVIRHLYGRPLETLLATFGISLVLQQMVRSVFSPLNKTVITPEWMSGSMQINGFLSLTNNRFYIIIFSLIVLLGLIFLLKKTFIGLQMRAVTQNRAMANSMGIRSNWVDALTFGLGSGIAGIAGVALSQLTNVGPNLGQAYIIDSFMVVVFGGVGNLFGTFFAAMSLGVANKFIEPMAGAVLGKIIVLVFIILFIQWRPRGLFALKGRFVED